MGEGRELAGRPVLVTGATGFIGSHLVRALNRLGARVHGLARRATPATRVEAGPVVWHAGDLTDAQSLTRAIEDAAPEVVFHLAAAGTTYDQQDADRIYRVNVAGTWNLWQSIASSSCRLVMAGTCGEYGRARGPLREDHACRPTWLYPATVHAAVTLVTTLARQTDHEVVVLRPFGPYGPADNADRVLPHVIEGLLRGADVPVTAGEQLRDFAYVDDHVAAFILAATRPLPQFGAIYNSASGTPRPLRTVIETAARIVGGDAIRRVRFGAVPYRPTEVWEMYADVEAARRDLGFSASVSLEEGLARTVAWYREHRSRIDRAVARS